MPIAPVAVGTKILGSKGNEIITAVNAQRVDHDALAALLHARTDAIGTVNGHTYNPGQLIADGGACQFDVQNWRSGITAVEDLSGWTVVTAGVYAISWGCQINASPPMYTSLHIQGVERARGPFGADSWSFGSWAGYITPGFSIVVRYHGGPTTPYVGGFIDIVRTGEAF